MLDVLRCKANTEASSIRSDNHYLYENLENGKETIEYLNVGFSLQINLNTMISGLVKKRSHFKPNEKGEMATINPFP